MKTGFISVRPRNNSDDWVLWFSVNGKPYPLERADFVKKTGMMYSPSGRKMKKFRLQVEEILMEQKGWSAKNSTDTFLGSDVNLDIQVTFYFNRPAYHFKGDPSNKIVKPEYESVLYARGKQDVDNLLKFVLDAMQGVVYRNDNQVVKVTGSKRYTTSDNGMPECTNILISIVDE